MQEHCLKGDNRERVPGMKEVHRIEERGKGEITVYLNSLRGLHEE